MTSADNSPFPTIAKMAGEHGLTWSAFDTVAQKTIESEGILVQALKKEVDGRIFDSDSSLVLCGSFARYEMVPDSDCDWTLLIDGVVNNQHAETARLISSALSKAKGIKAPGSSGTFGNLSFSHDLVHRIGGGADSNANLTRRVLMLLESRPLNISEFSMSNAVWRSVVGNILQRYFEEDVHFSSRASRTVPRFLLNDLTRYWRTIGVDYAAKFFEQGGSKWAIRNAKLRFSRKLLYAAGLAFCFSCDLNAPQSMPDLLTGIDYSSPASSAPFIEYAINFAETPPLEYLAQFVDLNVHDTNKKERLSKMIFGSYNEWLLILGDQKKRKSLEELSHEGASDDPVFQDVRRLSTEFAKGLQLLFFNHEPDPKGDPIAELSFKYVAF